MKNNHSPWGEIQHRTKLAPGIVSVSTSTHGGIWLDAKHAKKLEGVKNWLKSSQWWEEDCDWAIPYVLFRDEIQANNTAYNFNENLSHAWKTVESCHPEFFKTIGGL